MNIDNVFRALADKSRRHLLDSLIEKRGQNLGELCEQLSMKRQSVTKHLRILEEANLIAVEWKGREKLHYLNAMPIQEIANRWINKFERAPLAALSKLKRDLEREESC